MINVEAHKWDSSPSPTSDFKLVTKLTDLGSPASKKSLLGLVMNVTQDTASGTPPPTYSFNFFYREGPKRPWVHMHTFNSVYSTDQRDTVETVWIFPEPIKNIKNVQLKVKSGMLRGNIGINDFGLLYRVYRDTSKSSLDE